MMIQLIPVSQSHEKAEALRDIYLDAFPPDERRDWQDLMELTSHPHFNLHCILINNTPAGLITVWKWPELTFIEHFAVTKSMQGKGIGTEVLNLISQEGFPQIILETEEPLTEDARRRVNFYSRLGFYSCEEEYHQPPYSLDKKAVKMLLMSYPKKITQKEFITIRARLYKEVYQRNII